MAHYQFEKNARRNRRKALVFTLLFHAILIGGLAWSGNDDLSRFVPDTVKEWLGWTMPENDRAADQERTVVRP